jgi:hypothetical protein
MRDERVHRAVGGLDVELAVDHAWFLPRRY